MKSITLYCSELAALVGLNRFVKKTEAWDKVFQRSFKFENTRRQVNLDLGKHITNDLLGKEPTELISGLISSSSSSQVSDVIQGQETMVKEYTDKLINTVQLTVTKALEPTTTDLMITDSMTNLERTENVTNEIKKVLDTDFTELSSETKQVLQEKVKDLVSKREKEKDNKEKEIVILSELVSDLESVKDGACSTVRTSYGTKKESEGLEAFAEIFSSSHIQTTIKPKVMKINKNFLLYGVIDGMMDDDIVIEHKARTKRLFYADFHTEIYNYEYIQVQSYLFLYKKEQAYLVETLGNEVNYKTVFYDQDFLDSQVFSKLQFKKDINQADIEDYYYEKDSKEKLKKLSQLFSALN